MRFSAATTAEKILPGRVAARARPLLDQLDTILFARDERGVAGRMSFIAFSIRIFSAAIAFVIAFSVRGGALRRGWTIPPYKARPGRRPEDIP